MLIIIEIIGAGISDCVFFIYLFNLFTVHNDLLKRL